MPDRYEDMFEAARRHYLDGETMESIAHTMGVSRSTVSRLVARARDEGIVKVTMADHLGSRSPLAQRIAEEYGVRVHTVAVGEAAPPGVRFDQVARRAGSLISAQVSDDTVLGVAWGLTVSRVARHLEHRALSGVQVVQLNGSVNANDAGMPYVGSIMQAYADAYDATVTHLPVPAFFDSAETKRAMWRERSIQRVLALHEQIDLALFGVGAIHGRLPSHVYAAGSLTAKDLATLEQEGAVGDVCTVLIREDGSWSDISLNDRATGPTPAELQKIPRRLCVVADPARARAVRGALRAQVATDLVCDDVTAKMVLAESES